MFFAIATPCFIPAYTDQINQDYTVYYPLWKTENFIVLFCKKHTKYVKQQKSHKWGIRVGQIEKNESGDTIP